MIQPQQNPESTQSGPEPVQASPQSKLAEFSQEWELSPSEPEESIDVFNENDKTYGYLNAQFCLLAVWKYAGSQEVKNAAVSVGRRQAAQKPWLIRHLPDFVLKFLNSPLTNLLKPTPQPPADPPVGKLSRRRRRTPPLSDTEVLPQIAAKVLLLSADEVTLLSADEVPEPTSAEVPPQIAARGLSDEVRVRNEQPWTCAGPH